jgi:hypothetical protein
MTDPIIGKIESSVGRRTVQVRAAASMDDYQRLLTSPTRPVIHRWPLLNGSNAHGQTQHNLSLWPLPTG